jgi:CRP-like cAMP-binding protein
MTIDDDVTFFERVPTLGPLGRGALRILAIGADSRYVHSGEVLFEAGDVADGAFVVQEGSFALREKQAVVTDSVRVGPGTLLGELALITDTRRPVTATALEPSTVLRIPRALFSKMLDGYPEAAKRLRDQIAKRTEAATREVSTVQSLMDAIDRHSARGS